VTNALRYSAELGRRLKCKAEIAVWRAENRWFIYEQAERPAARLVPTRHVDAGDNFAANVAQEASEAGQSRRCVDSVGARVSPEIRLFDNL